MIKCKKQSFNPSELFAVYIYISSEPFAVYMISLKVVPSIDLFDLILFDSVAFCLFTEQC